MLLPVMIGMVASLGSCKGFLEEDALSKHIMDEFYRNRKDLEAGLLGVYAQAKTIYQGASLSITIVGTDEIYASNPSGNMGIADRYQYPADNSSTTNWYQTHYKIIQAANIIIHRGPQVPGIKEGECNMIVAEAKVIRAWCYFRLVQTFGRVPLELGETELFNFRIRRNPIEEVYRAIMEDLEYACGEGVLPTGLLGSEEDALATGRINHWVAKGLLAKVYLTLGTSIMRRPQPIDEYMELPYDPLALFAECRDLCDEIIASQIYSLVNDYGDVFLITKKNGRESMWELQFSAAPNLGSNWSKDFGVQQQSNPTAQSTNAMCGRGNFKPLPSFYRFFKLGDTRRIWNLADYRITFNSNTLVPQSLNYISTEAIDNVSSDLCNLDTDDPDWLERSLNSTPALRLGVSKYRWGVGDDPSLYWKEGLSFEADNAPNNVIVLRYADVLLMRIEADMLCNQGVAGDVSLAIMNNQLLPRARGWNIQENRFVTEQEMMDTALAPYQALIDAAQELYDLDPTSQELADNLQAAQDDFEVKKARCLVNYSDATLTYEELMKQRACELCFEFHRWFDLCRTGTLHTLVPARIVNPNTVPQVNFRFDVNYLMPIPTHELDLASDKTLFYQNPGY